jgi:hypothetical protein
MVFRLKLCGFRPDFPYNLGQLSSSNKNSGAFTIRKKKKTTHCLETVVFLIYFAEKKLLQLLVEDISNFLFAKKRIY